MGEKSFTIEIKWGTSRGRDTYGYTTCSLYVFGRKVESCNGGGYDMAGTVIGHWLARAFSPRLCKLEIPMSRRNGRDVREYYGLTFHDPNYNPGTFVLPNGKTVAQAEADGDSLGLDRYQAFYGASSNVPTERHTVPSISYGIGLSSVLNIARALGLTFEKIKSSSRSDIWLVVDTKAEEKVA